MLHPFNPNAFTWYNDKKKPSSQTNMKLHKKSTKIGKTKYILASYVWIKLISQ